MRYFDSGKIIIILLAIASIILSILIDDFRRNFENRLESKKCAEKELNDFIFGKIKQPNFDKCSKVE